MATHEAKAEAHQTLLALGRETSADAVTLAAIILTARRFIQDDDTILQILGMVETLMDQRLGDHLAQYLAAVVALANHEAQRLTTQYGAP
jgi:hypothetical protein